MIDNADQDEWFNLYLYLGSCWVNKSRYDTQYDTGHEVRTELRSLDQLIELKTENRAGRKGVSTRKSSWSPKFANQESRHKVELNPDVWGPGLLLKPVTKSLTEEGSVRGRSLHHLPDQPGTRISLCSCSLRRTDPDFSVNVFKSNIR